LITFGKTSINGWLTAAIGLVTFAVIYRTSLNPLWMILGGAVVGAIALR
jgi:hypothetical protein